MRIAVLLGGVRFDAQRRIISGIMEKAKEEETDIYIFTCDVWTYSTTLYNKGETAIFDLPDFKIFDGIILHGDTIYDTDVMRKVISRIKQSGVPCISLNVRYEDMLYVGMENASGVYEIVNHLIRVHHCKKLCFISGPYENADSIGRLNGYRQALEENGIEFDENYIYYGDYHPDSGKEAVSVFYEMQEEFPDAIVAANDEMALGAFYELQRLGYEVPERVRISGYDYAFAGRNHYPKITTVKRPETELGKKAYEKLCAYIRGESVEREEELRCMPVFTESCGCRDLVTEDEKDFRRRFVKNRLHVTTYSEIIKSSSADFTGTVTFEQLLEKIRKYIIMIDPEEFYLCMCVREKDIGNDIFSKINDEAAMQDVSTYSSEIMIPILYRNGKIEQYGRFKTEELLPEKFTKGKKGEIYTIVPIHYQERCYGYCVLGKSKLMIDSELFHLFLMNINNALENIRKQSMLNAMVERLNRMWVYDTLTGIFNRAGFFKFADNIIEEARNKKNQLFVLFLDLDGLKRVNDRYGHDEGDAYIKAMANVLNQVRRHGELLMRYGGDEFVVLAQGYTPEDADEYIKKVRAGIKGYNESSSHEYTLDASMGYIIVEPVEGFDLEAMIDLADREMYKEKNEKNRTFHSK